MFEQEPREGTKLENGSIVVFRVSTGKKKVTVPDVRGLSQEQAVTTLTRAGLETKVVSVNSPEPEDTVTAQAPAPGEVVVEGAEVRINVSKGPKPIVVPSVVGLLYDTAAGQLQTAGFAVGRRDEDSDRPAGEVIAQNPAGNSLATAGTSVTLTVSRGPQTTAIPDVTNQDATLARDTLEAAGFKVSITSQDTDDPSLDEVVMSQDSGAGKDAKPDRW